ncbi:MAG: ribose-phosphate diphosphokinase [Planctomycetota bacterium]
MYDRLMLFTGRVSHYLSEKILYTLRKFPGFQGVELYEPEVITFDNENLKVKITESVRGADVFVIQTAASSWHAPRGVNPETMDPEDARNLNLSESLLELLIMVDALRGASAGRITVVTPYYPYARSDKKDEPRISITARLMGQLFNQAGADRILAVNLHALQIQGFAPMPFDQLDANPLIADYFRQEHDLSNLGVLATDAGGVKWATKYAEMLNCPLAVCDKRRWEDNEDPEIRNVIGSKEIQDRNVAIFDDEILTGGTMTTAIEVLKDRFNLPVSYVSCVHPVLAPGAIEKIKDAGVKQVVTSDTLPPPGQDDFVKVVSSAPLIAAAIRNIHTNESVTQIFKQPSFLLGGEQGDLW